MITNNYRKGGNNERRDRFDIIDDILEKASGGRPKTHIMYKANLSHSQIERYLDFLIDKRLLENTTVKQKRKILYKTTDKGLKYLEIHGSIKSMLVI